MGQCAMYVLVEVVVLWPIMALYPLIYTARLS